MAKIGERKRSVDIPERTQPDWTIPEPEAAPAQQPVPAGEPVPA